MEKERNTTDLQILEREITGLKDMMDTPIRSEKERVELETKLKPILKDASNQAIVKLFFHNKPYARREVEERIEKGKQFEIDDIWDLGEKKGLGGVDMQAKSNKQLFNTMVKAFKNSVPGAEKEEVAEFIARKSGTSIDLNTIILPQAISYRDDIDDVIELARGFINEPDGIGAVDQDLDVVQTLAHRFRNEREKNNNLYC